MKTYETVEGVNEYFKMCEGLDNTFLKSNLEKHLTPGKTMLEIGMGPGNDFSWLKEKYKITGSDYSNEFLKRAKKRFPKDHFLKLDAISIETKKHYDSIFSNKVYQHFTMEKLEESFTKQSQILNDGGIIIHTFWVGDYIYKHEDMIFYYHNKGKLIDLITENFNILDQITYKEFENEDSLLIIARKKISY